MIKPTDITLDFLDKRPLSKSSLSQFYKSPKDYIAYLNKTFKETKAFKIGKLTDLYILEPERFDKIYKISPYSDGRTAKAKAFKEKYSKDFEIVVQSDIEDAKRMREAIYAHPEAKELLLFKQNIQKKFYKEIHGLKFVGIKDFEVDEWTIDLKTIDDASHLSFQNQVYKYFYWLQEVIYAPHKTKFLVVQKTPPYHVEVYKLSTKYVNWAQNELIGLCEAFKYCIEEQQFHKGYDFLRPFGADEIQKPNYAKHKFGG